MNRYSILLFAVVLSVAVACAPSAPATNAPAAPSTNATVPPQSSSAAVAIVTPSRVAVPSAAPTFAPNPLNVQVKVDSKITASAVISATGGTLSVQGADGTKFTLTFPKGALFNDERITLTPITAVDGLPFSGELVGGVQMAPEGLRLFQPATLTIESPKTVAAKGFETVAFAYHQNGEGLYLNTAEVKGNLLTLEVWHFSGEGAAQATSAEIQTQQQRVPSNAEDAFTQRVREYLGRERQAQLLPGQNPDPDMQRTMGEFLREAYDRFIGPQLPIALTNCEAAPAILSKALGWLRQVQLLGYGDRFQAESTLITDTMLQALVNCYNKAYDKCVANDDLSQIVVMLAYLRQGQLLGVGDRLDQSKIEKCGSFDLEFESTIRREFALFISTYRAHSTVLLRPQITEIKGQAPIELDLNEVSGSEYFKVIESGATGGNLQASLIGPPSGLGASTSFDLTSLTLVLNPGRDTRYAIQQSCSPAGCGPEVTDNTPLWLDLFQALHQDEGGAGGYSIRGWTKSGAILTKPYARTKSFNGFPVQETTTLKLTHKAQ